MKLFKYFIPIYGIILMSLEEGDDTVQQQIGRCLRFIGIMIYNVVIMLGVIQMMARDYEDLADSAHVSGFNVALCFVTICGTILMVKGGIMLIQFMRKRLYDKK